ncbi:hypothetical protein BGZ76_004402 [Entomortierella beljakovae]|nr:hypothetical protein BGZ76_004402 [Entomortierella beljakovae]
MDSNKQPDMIEQTVGPDINNPNTNSGSSQNPPVTITDIFDGLVDPPTLYSDTLTEYLVIPQTYDDNTDFDRFHLSDDFDSFIVGNNNPGLSGIPDFTECNTNTVFSNLFTADEVSLASEEHQSANNTLVSTVNTVNHAHDISASCSYLLNIPSDTLDTTKDTLNTMGDALTTSVDTLLATNGLINLVDPSNGIEGFVNPLLDPLQFNYVYDTFGLTQDMTSNQPPLYDYSSSLFAPLTMADLSQPTNAANTIGQTNIITEFDINNFESNLSNQNLREYPWLIDTAAIPQLPILTQPVVQTRDPTLSQEVPLRDLLLDLLNPSPLFINNEGLNNTSQDQLVFAEEVSSHITKKRKSDKENSNQCKRKTRKKGHSKVETLIDLTTTHPQETDNYFQSHHESGFNEQQQQWLIRNQLLQNQIHRLLSQTPISQNDAQNTIDPKLCWPSEGRHETSEKTEQQRHQERKKARKDESRRRREEAEEQHSSRLQEFQSKYTQHVRRHQESSEHIINVDNDNNIRKVQGGKVKKDKKPTDSAHYRPRNAFFMYRGLVSKLQSDVRNRRLSMDLPSLTDSLLSTSQSYQDPPDKDASGQQSKGLPQTKVSECCGKLWKIECNASCKADRCKNCRMRSLFEKASDFLKLRQAEIERNIQFPVDDEDDEDEDEKKLTCKSKHYPKIKDGERSGRSRNLAASSKLLLQLSLENAFNWEHFKELYLTSDLFSWHRDSCPEPKAESNFKNIKEIWLENERIYEMTYTEAARKRIEQDKTLQDDKEEEEQNPQE